MAKNLGNVTLWIKKGQIIAGVAAFDPNNQPCAGIGIGEVKPTDGDRIIIEFAEVPEEA